MVMTLLQPSDPGLSDSGSVHNQPWHTDGLGLHASGVIPRSNAPGKQHAVVSQEDDVGRAASGLCVAPPPDTLLPSVSRTPSASPIDVLAAELAPLPPAAPQPTAIAGAIGAYDWSCPGY